jgi:hypothetical protein
VIDAGTGSLPKSWNSSEGAELPISRPSEVDDGPFGPGTGGRILYIGAAARALCMVVRTSRAAYFSLVVRGPLHPPGLCTWSG